MQHLDCGRRGPGTRRADRHCGTAGTGRTNGWPAVAGATQRPGISCATRYGHPYRSSAEGGFECERSRSIDTPGGGGPHCATRFGYADSSANGHVRLILHVARCKLLLQLRNGSQKDVAPVLPGGSRGTYDWHSNRRSRIVWHRRAASCTGLLHPEEKKPRTPGRAGRNARLSGSTRCKPPHRGRRCAPPYTRPSI